MIKIVKKIKALIAHLGWRLTGFYLLRRGIERFIPHCRIYAYQLVAQPVCNRPPLAKRYSLTYQIREVSREEYNFTWFPRPAQVIYSRYNQGCICLIAFKEETAVGCIWLCPGPYMEDEVRCCFIPMPANEAAWDFDIYISPKFRLGRLFALLWQAANTWLVEHGICWTMSRIDLLNRESLRAHQRIGAQPVGTAIFVLFGFTQIMLSSLVSRPHLSRNAASIPRLEIKAPK